MEAKFTPHTKYLIQLSKQLALEIGNNQIETEHLLLAIIKDPLNKGKNGNRAFEILKGMKVDFKKLEKELYSFLVSLHKTYTSERPANFELDISKNLSLSKQAEKVVKISYLEAKILRSDIIGSEHLLLSIFRDENKFYEDVLGPMFNIDYESLKDFIENNKASISKILENFKMGDNIDDVHVTNDINYAGNDTLIAAALSELDQLGVEEQLIMIPEEIVRLGIIPEKQFHMNLFEKERSPLDLIFSNEDFSNEEIKEIIGLLSELYSSIGGDYLKVVGMSQFECKIELAE